MRSPEEVQRMIFLEPPFSISDVKSSHEKSFKSHVRIEPCVGGRMAERIEQPAHSRRHSELLLEKLMSGDHVVNNILVSGASFVVCRPTAVQEFKSALLHKLLESVFNLLRLSVVPQGKKLHFNVGKLSVGLEGHLLDY